MITQFKRWWRRIGRHHEIRKPPSPVTFETRDGHSVPGTEAGQLPEGAAVCALRFSPQAFVRYVRPIRPEDVAACTHPAQAISVSSNPEAKTISRQCRLCYGHQTVPMVAANLLLWPPEWSSHGFVEEATIPLEIDYETVEAMYTSGKYSLDEAMAIVPHCCRKCRNIIRYECGWDPTTLDSEDSAVCIYCMDDEL